MIHILIVVLFLSPGIVVANNNFDLSTLKKGQTLLNISAKESKKVSQDLLVASVQFSSEGENKSRIQNDVNKTIKKALDIIKQEDSLTYSTEAYYVYQIYSNRSNTVTIKPSIWKAQQSIRIESKDGATLLETVGNLQEDGLHLNYLRYTLSSESFEQVSDSLMKAALIKLQARADEAAQALGKSLAKLIDVTVNNSHHFVNQSRIAVASLNAETAPSAEPGKTDVSLTVSAKALLEP